MAQIDIKDNTVLPAAKGKITFSNLKRQPIKKVFFVPEPLGPTGGP